MEKFYQKSIEKTVEHFKSDAKIGLSEKQAKQRLEEVGPNTIQQQEATTVWELLWHNFNNLIVYLLLAAAVLSFFMGDMVEAVAIIIAVLLAVLTGFFTELSAQKSIDSLQSMIYTTTKVIRDGKVTELNSAEVVPGDILVLTEGDAIAADARIIESRNFACIESALTGEAEAVDKNWQNTYEEDIPLGDRKNSVFAGTAVTRGNAKAIVTETGMQTEVGKISSMLNSDKREKTPLDVELDKLGKAVIIAALFAGAVVLIAGLLTQQPVVEMIHISIILAVAAIPEAMPAVSTITLSRGMRIMAEHKALVKTLSSVETLGATSVICSDKTGTLTENQMTVEEIILADGSHYTVTGNGYHPEGEIKKETETINLANNEELRAFIRNGSLCTTSSLQETDGHYEVVGDPTDGALVVLGEKAGLGRDQLTQDGFEKVGELPFDSENKFMIVVYEKETRVLIMKGALDVMLRLAKTDQDMNKNWEKYNDRLAANGKRVLAVAAIEDYQGSLEDDKLTQSLEGLKIQGLVGIIDPPREDVKESIRLAQEAGIQVKMITGDHPKTASIIARDIGLANYDRIMTGQEIDKEKEEPGFSGRADDVAVFARVSPENKRQLVQALRKEGEVVAMTGDGVNDAPALNSADIGVAMGIRGTEVAKESSDMILTDDRFSTIVEAVKEGRIIFDNIKKYVTFLFSCNMVEIVTIFLSVIFLMPLPIQPLHILYLNLVIDIAPAMALAFEPAEDDIMKRKPRSKTESLVNRTFLGKIILSGVVIGVIAFLVFNLFNRSGVSEMYAQTATFTYMAVAQLLHIFNVRKQNRFGLDASIFENKPLLGALAISVSLQLIAVYLPVMNRLLGTTPLDVKTWGIILAAAILSAFVVKLLKNSKLLGNEQS